MAAITPTEIISKSGKIIGYKWASVSDTTSGVDTCTPVRFDEDIDDLTLSIHGTVGASASVALRIDNDYNGSTGTDGLLTDYIAGTDVDTTNAIALDTDNTGALVLEVGRYYQPVVTGDTNNNTVIDIILVGK